MNKFKVGDKPRIRSDLKSYVKYGEYTAVPGMQALWRGMVLAITEVIEDGYRLNNLWYVWTDKMFEAVASGEHRKPEPPKPEPIMIGGKELKAGSKFILKPFDTHYNFYIDTAKWDRLYGEVLEVKSIINRENVVRTASHSWLIKFAAIDRIIEVTP